VNVEIGEFELGHLGYLECWRGGLARDVLRILGVLGIFGRRGFRRRPTQPKEPVRLRPRAAARSVSRSKRC
jgi:hypothetical protein